MVETRSSGPSDLREIVDGVFVFLTWLGAWSILDILRVTARLDAMLACLAIGLIGMYASYHGLFVYSRIDDAPPAIDLPLLEVPPHSSRGGKN